MVEHTDKAVEVAVVVAVVVAILVDLVLHHNLDNQVQEIGEILVDVAIAELAVDLVLQEVLTLVVMVDNGI